MNEPVAYMWKTVQGTITGLAPNDNSYSGGRFGIPLYTLEQLHPRVKMTQAEFETFKNIKQKNNLLSDALSATAFFGNEKQQSEKQIEFASLFINLDLNKPEETIEIVPDFKWFVRNKQKGKDDVIDYLMIDDDVWFGWHPFVTRDEATAFDTKEEAEKWTNPLTEAVQLPAGNE